MDFAAALSTKSAKALFLPIGNLAKSAKTALSFGIIRPDCPEDVIRIRTHLYGQLSTGLASESSSSPLWPMFEQSISHQSGGRLARHLLRLADRAELGGSVVMDVLLDGPYGSVFVDVYGSRGAHVVPLAEDVWGQGGWRKNTGDPSAVS
ncbi:hypothetical protein GN244_ATG04604 [Phytophthora infestans]|uniref:Uncharacterized protein n=1 Tax=Phytophthora infestans TaxID=4787 RepID=A0A833SMI3_PHYIN|nr:hypothetical protein GN244_ATG04604 [Phytophthora infestans]KAF4130902.1 hypothetical protein GN958_ATG19907 [Phytophthora infestans]KAI9981565.1 hypothetical protein PInf_009321 [Phytophthora infestans]